MEERKIIIEYDTTAEDAINIVVNLLNEFGVKHKDDGEGTITYWVDGKLKL